MAQVIAGQSVTLLAQFYDFSGGTLTNLDATPTITITNIGTAAVALAATTSGVTHPATGSYGYTWTPASTLAAGDYLASWSGTSSSVAVTATETVTVLAENAGSTAAPSGRGVWYVTREQLKNVLDVRETARSDDDVDRVLETASRTVEGDLNRVFYPYSATKHFDWPNRQYARPWRLWLDDNELITLTALTSGGTTIPTGNVLLEPNEYGPPYNRLELDVSSSSAFSSGSTYQRSITVTGLFGYTDNETTLGSTVAAVSTTSATTVNVDGATSAAVGVGSLLRLDSERVVVTDRSQLDTGQNLGGNLTAADNSVTVAVTDGTAYARREVILIDAEKMRVDDIAGNNLTVTRAWNGTVLAAHTAGADIYAPRTLTIRRGALGTTAATHVTATTVYRWDPPGPVAQLTLAEAVNDLLQGRSGYARVAGAGEAQREMTGRGLDALRKRVMTSHGRMARLRGV